MSVARREARNVVPIHVLPVHTPAGSIWGRLTPNGPLPELGALACDQSTQTSGHSAVGTAAEIEINFCCGPLLTVAPWVDRKARHSGPVIFPKT